MLMRNLFSMGSLWMAAFSTDGQAVHGIARYPDATVEYVQTWGRTNLQRWSQPVGDQMRTMAPQVFGNVPASAFLGFASAASQYEDTGVRRPDGSLPNPTFHEVGFLGIEAGRSGGPSPAVAPGAGYNNWGQLHAHPDVRALLGGHDASMAPRGWYNLPDQIAVGLVNLREHGTATGNRLDASIRPRRRDSLWFVAIALSGWSSGGAGFAALINSRYRERLAAVDEDHRWGELLRLVAADVRCGRLHGPAHSYTNQIYTLMRSTQKLEAGHALATATGNHPEWFDTHLGADQADIYATLTRGGLGYPLDNLALTASSGACARTIAATAPTANPVAGPVLMTPSGTICQTPPDANAAHINGLVTEHAWAAEPPVSTN